ncbi:MAG: DUF2034 domain-containing protein [Endozoicomonas sp.]|uniref:DUF2034 domain-containing protein n=1 Tax=Endozoicomonas sp. TaxID=1892382 RepID=UPI003D9ACECE
MEASNPAGSSSVNSLNLSHLQEMDWKRFEVLCKDYFHAKGFEARLTDIGADGGIDIIISRPDAANKADVFVQCKAWSHQKIGVKAIRELYGVMAAHGVQQGVFITSSDFTDDARAFAENKKLLLLSGTRLLKLIEQLPLDKRLSIYENTLAGDYKTPTCPTCDIKMVLRTRSKGKSKGERFWGCSNYPKCHQMLHTKADTHYQDPFRSEDEDEPPLRAYKQRPTNTFPIDPRIIIGIIAFVVFVLGISSIPKIFTMYGDSLVQHSQELAEKQQQKLKEAQRLQAVEKARLAQEAKARAELSLAKARAEAAENRRILEEKRKQQEEQRRKDDTFETWYHTPWECEGIRANENMVECVNRRMRSKAEFEKLWAEGEFK